ncbi:MAG: hypothetical protein ACMUIA_10425 [bacterium]
MLSLNGRLLEASKLASLNGRTRCSLRQRPFLTLSFTKKLHQKTPYAAPAANPPPLTILVE